MTHTTTAPAPSGSPVPPETERPAPAPSLWRDRGYLAWLASDTSSALASSVQGFVLPLVVLLLTGDPAVAGSVAALGLAARVLTTIVGGVLADRHDLRRLMILGGALGAVVLTLMALAYAAGLGVLALAALNVVAGVRSGLFGSASNAALRQAVPAGLLPRAMSANQGRDAALAMGGGPLGGLLLGLGPVVALGAAAGAHLLAALSALGLRGSFAPVARPEGHRASMRREAAEGLRWLWRQPVLRTIALVAAVLNLGLNAALTTVLYSFGAQGVSPGRLGLVSLALGVGMLLGSLVAGTLVDRLPTGWVAAGGLAWLAASVAVLPWLPGFWPTLVVLGLGTVAAPAINAGVLGYLMHVTPRAVLGRVSSAIELLSAGAVPLAPVVAGLGLATVGLRGTLLVSAGCCLLALVLVLAGRDVRRLPRPAQWGAAPE
ncbi:MFS transporter [Ornithinimicrobium flavum]|uniref:MFS transporter n=1 Tax=Ornithinimicrobium flavum TaxID=1288636 RepID=UPI00106F844C|nr:MFS transporter [Ornithinimicrobium flavum]